MKGFSRLHVISVLVGNLGISSFMVAISLMPRIATIGPLERISIASASLSTGTDSRFIPAHFHR